MLPLLQKGFYLKVICYSITFIAVYMFMYITPKATTVGTSSYVYSMEQRGVLQCFVTLDLCGESGMPLEKVRRKSDN